jgi:hypothetical protein
MTFEDDAALDAWVMNGYHAEKVPHSLRERARRHERLASMVTSVEAPEGKRWNESLIKQLTGGDPPHQPACSP